MSDYENNNIGNVPAEPRCIIPLTMETDSIQVQNRKQEIVNMTQQIIENITTGDFDTFQVLTEPNLSVFEPETVGELMQGQQFHRLYFDPVLREGIRGMHHEFINPVVHLLGENAAAIAFVRLTQYIDGQGVARTDKVLETRVWQRRNGQWRVVHYHGQATSTQQA